MKTNWFAVILIALGFHLSDQIEEMDNNLSALKASKESDLFKDDDCLFGDLDDDV